jgi:methylthioribose-1-phosphate isomerase
VQPILAVDWSPDRRALRVLDQRALPSRETLLDLTTVEETADAIRTLAVRGAPAIGGRRRDRARRVARDRAGNDGAGARSLLPGFAARLVQARPTAVNLAWAVGRMVARAAREGDAGLLDALRDEAETIRREDVAMCDAIGVHGLPLLKEGARVLTHCNAGRARDGGERHGARTGLCGARTRAPRRGVRRRDAPLLQGARLTAWELERAEIPVTVLPDGAAASLLASGTIDIVLVGADRIAANGDVANKIGTYGVALAARAHDVPFYVAAPWSTIDPAHARRRAHRHRAPRPRRARPAAGTGQRVQSPRST